MELRRELLRRLREDEEFRLAVAGLLGLGEMLQELKRLREDFNNYVRRSEERWRAWLEIWQKFTEEQERRWEENRKRREDDEKRWAENEKRRQVNRQWWKKTRREGKRKRGCGRRLGRIEEVLGDLAEARHSHYVWLVLSEVLAARGERFVGRLRNVRVRRYDGHLLVETNGFVYVVEVKVRPVLADLKRLVAEAAEAAHGKPAVAVLTGSMVGDGVL